MMVPLTIKKSFLRRFPRSAGAFNHATLIFGKTEDTHDENAQSYVSGICRHLASYD